MHVESGPKMARQRNRSGKSKQASQKPKEKKIEPRLPASLLRELGQPTNKRRRDHQAKEEKKKQVNDENEDLYEYEEGVPEEELGKNRRFDNVDSHEYTLPPDFEDEEVDEDVETEDERGSESGFEEGIDGLVDSFEGGTEASEDDREHEKHGGEEEEDNEDEDDDGDEDDDDDNERHRRMIELVTGKQAVKVDGKKGRKNMLLSEAYPESEYNLNPPAGDDGKEITVEDLMSSLQDTTGFGALRKRMRQLEKKGALVQAPLAKCEMDKLERKAGYEEVKKDVTRWMPIVKKNREAPTVVYNQRPAVPVSNVAVLAAHFHPTSNFEKEISSLLHKTGIHDPRKVEEAEVLALNKMTVEEVRERQARLSKMRSLLFQHEIRAKRIKKIKSKTYHKLLQKSKRSKARSTDPEVLKDEAMKQEFKRAQERMTLKHKNTSKWAKRVLKRGLDKHQDDGTKDAIAEQLRAHALLTQKIHSATLSSDESDSEDEQSDGDELSGLVLEKKPGSKILARAKVETLKALEGDEEAEIPTSGLFALPFMVRAIEKKRKEAQGDASQLLKQLENAEDDDDADFMDSKNTTVGVSSGPGPRMFGDVPPSKRGNLSKSSPYDDPDKQSNSEDEGLSGDELSLETGKCLPNNMVHSRTNSCSAANAQLHGEEDEDNHGLMNPAVAHSTQTSGPITVAPATSQGGQDGTGSTHVTDILTCSIKVNNTHKKQKVSKTGSEASLRNSVLQTNPMIFGDAKMTSSKPEVEHQVKIAGKRSRKQAKKTKLGHDSNSSNGHESIRSDTINNAEHALVRGLPMEIQQARHTHEINGDVMPFNNDGLVDAGENDENIGLFRANEFLMGMESQSELIKQAFAGDDVEEEFEAAKTEVLNEEVPKGESDKILPGWGQWTDVQKKKGQPTWLVKQQEDLEQQRGKALTKRKDAKLKHVIISEKMDRKANKFMSASLPFPYTPKDVFEKTLRMPIGREYNTDEAFRNMIRPSEIKSTGLVIAPINYRLKEKDDDALTSTRENERRSRGQKNIGHTLKRKHAVGSKDDGFLSLKSLKPSQTQPVK